MLIPNDNGYTFPLKEAADRAAGTIGKVAEDAVPEDVEEDPQREDDHGAPQPTPNTMPQVIREESTLPAPEAGSAGPSDPVRPARGVDKAPVPAPEAETLEDDVPYTDDGDFFDYFKDDGDKFDHAVRNNGPELG